MCREYVMSDASQQIERLEHAFWQSMVDGDPAVATGMLAERALMVSGHGAMAFDHAGYTKMARDGAHKLVDYTLSDMQVLFPSDGVAIATYKVDQLVEHEGASKAMAAVDSSTWVRTDGAWKCVAHTESLQPAEH
ncbi:MAG: nuclear transport factor 2 family protein [Lysobacteraceae bacterium]|nr:MAG: nuclear transport factor 2 family protein [Xanthomonadaceae bacterium]